MPRNGSDIYFIPPGTEGFPDTTIESKKYNDYIHDVETDLNTPRPISVGGTGANDADEALANLSAEKAYQLVENYDSHVFVPGSFYSHGPATGGPISGAAISGICYIHINTDYMTLEAREMLGVTEPGRVYVRQKRAGIWGPWVLDGPALSGPNPPLNPPEGTLWWDSEGGHLYVWYTDANSSQWVIASPFPDPAQFVNKSGDTMNGPLNLTIPMTDILHAANKGYVDQHISAATAGLQPQIDSKVNRSGDTMTGSLNVNGQLNGTSIRANVDIWSSFSSSVGYYHFGTSGTKYLSYEGSNNSFNFIGGPLNVQNGDISGGALITSRIGLPGEGLIYFGNSGVRYLHYTNNAYNFVGTGINVTGTTTTGTFFQSYLADVSLGGNGGGVYFRPYGMFNETSQAILTPDGHFTIYGGNASIRPTNNTTGGFWCKDGSANQWPAGDYYFNVAWNGNLLFYIHSTFVGSLPSDYRIKKDISLLPSTWETVKKLKPIKYTQREYTPLKERENSKKTGVPFVPADDNERWGFAAHELQETLVESVASGKKDQDDCIQSINPMAIIAALTKALQEAMTRIEALEART